MLFIGIIVALVVGSLITWYLHSWYKKNQERKAREQTFGWQLQTKIEKMWKEAWANIAPQNERRLAEATKKLKEEQTVEIDALHQAYAHIHEGPYPTKGPWAQQMQSLLTEHKLQVPKHWPESPDGTAMELAKAEGFAAYTAKGPRLWIGEFRRNNRDWQSFLVLASSAEEAADLIASKFGSNANHVRNVWPAE
jgi:hypothetical protein